MYNKKFVTSHGMRALFAFYRHACLLPGSIQEVSFGRSNRRYILRPSPERLADGYRLVQLLRLPRSLHLVEPNEKIRYGIDLMMGIS